MTTKWKPTGSPLTVDEEQPVDPTEGVTKADEQTAFENWARVSPIQRAYVGRVQSDADALIASLINDKSAKSSLAATSDLAQMLGAGKRTALKQWAPPMLPRGFEQFSATATLTDLGQSVREHQASVLREGVDVFEPMIREFFRGQRSRVLTALAKYKATGNTRSKTFRIRHKADGTALSMDGIFNLSLENSALQDAYLPALDQVAAVAVASPPDIPGSLSWDLSNPNISAVRDQLATKVVGINDTTRSAIADQVSEGIRRGYSVTQIANGNPDENYAGIQGVFASASDARSETIARTESAFAFAAATELNYREAGIDMVEILDGVDYDEECATADGEVWTLDDYANNPIAHPNCTRAAVPSDAAVATGSPG